MAGKAARAAVERCGKQPRYNKGEELNFFSHRFRRFSRRLHLPRRRSEPDWRFAKADLH